MKQPPAKTVLIAAVLLVLTGLCGLEARAGDDKTVGDKVRQVLPPSEPVFSVREVTVIQTYFRTHRRDLPPGLAKRDKLPPGIAKQLRKKGKLPHDIEVVVLPVELERQLVVLPTAYRRVVIGGNVVLMEPRTGLIYDIVREVIP